jgi:4-hydroxythreonine-4-phosphate dehydrogenase
MIRIGITMGDPKGIGPEIVAKTWGSISPDLRSLLRIYGDKAVLDAAAKIAGVAFDPKQLIITSSSAPPVGSISDPDAARAAILAIDAAAEDAKRGMVQALVTAPVNKHRMQFIDPFFEGHTERLAHSAGVKDVVMMFACPRHMPKHEAVRISLVTSHVAIKDVSSRLSKQRILTTIQMSAHALKNYFECESPRIAVMGLNPHAGENGLLGTEEKEIIAPAIEKARKEGIICIGPMLAETIFKNINNIDYDCIVAMYHDQGLTPMKIICPQKSVNITLGLPFIRTSPGHGTAEDIAWTNQASEVPMTSAIEMAVQLLKTNLKL